jgi:hypothetical protein
MLVSEKRHISVTLHNPEVVDTDFATGGSSCGLAPSVDQMVWS